MYLEPTIWFSLTDKQCECFMQFSTFAHKSNLDGNTAINFHKVSQTLMVPNIFLNVFNRFQTRVSKQTTFSFLGELSLKTFED